VYALKELAKHLKAGEFKHSSGLFIVKYTRKLAYVFQGDQDVGLFFFTASI